MGVRHREHAAGGRAVPSRVHPHDARARTCWRTSSMARGTSRARARMKAFLQKVMAGQPLEETEAADAMAVVMEGEATPAQIGALLGAIAARGETEDEVVGFARAMRARAVRACARRAPSTPAAPAATGRARSTSRRSRRWWSRPAACRSPSTATARPAAAAAAPTCSRRSGVDARSRSIEAVQRCARRVRLGLPVRARLPRRDAARGGAAQGAGRAHRLQPARAAHQPGVPGRAGGRRAAPGADRVPGALPRAARRAPRLGGARGRPRRDRRWPGRRSVAVARRTAAGCASSRSTPEDAGLARAIAGRRCAGGDRRRRAPARAAELLDGARGPRAGRGRR